MKAEKMLLATPLLKWYLKHGMKVTRIYQVVEFTPQQCFKDFQDEVSTARRFGDSDPSKSIIADTMKLIGNSAYGSLIMDKERHQDIKYVKGERKASMLVNDKSFKKLTILDNDLYEIECAKKKICLNLPIYLGYFILQYAKLRMLEWYYDCLDEFVAREDFEYMEMDTGMHELGLSSECMLDIELGLILFRVFVLFYRFCILCHKWGIFGICD